MHLGQRRHAFAGLLVRLRSRRAHKLDVAFGQDAPRRFECAFHRRDFIEAKRNRGTEAPAC